MNTHAHAQPRPTLVSRLVSLFQRHDDLPGDAAPEYTRADVLSARAGQVAAQAPEFLPAPEDLTAFEQAAGELRRSGSGHAPADEPWWGATDMDIPPQHHRPYVPDALDLFPPAVTIPDPGPLADLGTCLIFRDTVRAVFVRQEQARGFRAPRVPWHERYAGLYRARTSLPVIGCFGIADALVQAHEEAKAALTADVRDRIDRITAPAGYAAEAAA
jgi:hypothetical protein